MNKFSLLTWIAKIESLQNPFFERCRCHIICKLFAIFLMRSPILSYQSKMVHQTMHKTLGKKVFHNN